jgi:hypothetical protein
MNPFYINACLRTIFNFIERATQEERLIYMDKYNLIELLSQISQDKYIMSDKFYLIKILAELTNGKEEARYINNKNTILKVRALKSIVSKKESYKIHVFIFLSNLIEYV